MKIIGKVISDNGYKIEVIRPLKDACLSIGMKVEIEICKEQVNLINLFDNLIDEETQNMIMDKFNEASKQKPKTEETKASGGVSYSGRKK